MGYIAVRRGCALRQSVAVMCYQVCGIAGLNLSFILDRGEILKQLIPKEYKMCFQLEIPRKPFVKKKKYFKVFN